MRAIPLRAAAFKFQVKNKKSRAHLAGRRRQGDNRQPGDTQSLRQTGDLEIGIEVEQRSPFSGCKRVNEMASTASTMKTESTALSGLPAPFLDAMRKLFDIMDCDRVGWIHIDGKSVTKPGPPHPDPDPDPEPHLTSPESRLERSNAKMFNLITHFSPPDIAHRWQSQEASNPGLPKNVVQNLRKVMNKEGRLSFERFCAGLKISILRHEAERNRVDKRNKVNE